MGNRTNTAGGDNVGRDKNSDSAIKILGTVMCVMAIAIAWMFYYITVANKQEMPRQPTELIVPK